MANVKITDLAELAATPDNADILEIVDMAPTPTSKKITAANLRAGLAASGANADITSMTGLTNGGIPVAKVANGDIATDTIWDAAGDTVYGTGANTASRLAAGAANLKYFMNAAGTAPEWANGVAASSMTRDMSLGSGDVAYSGIGFKPSCLIVVGHYTQNGGTNACWGFGTAGFNQCCKYSGGTFYDSNSRFIELAGNLACNVHSEAIIKSFDSDGYTLAWTRYDGSGIASFIVLAFR